MEFLWLLLVMATMVVYPVFLIRNALKGKRWALEALEALRYIGGDMTASGWRPLPPPGERKARARAARQGEAQHPAPQAPAAPQPDEQQADEEPGRFVA
jgi:hypothetical protein